MEWKRAALALAILMLARTCGAGYQASKACNMCRIEREPPQSKLPDEYTSCADYYPSPQCPLTDNIDVENLNDTSIDNICQTDPYANDCGKKENTKGSGKFYSSKNQGNGVLTAWTVGWVIEIIRLTAVVMVVLLLSCNRSTSSSNPQVFIDENINRQEDAYGRPIGQKIPFHVGSSYGV